MTVSIRHSPVCIYEWNENSRVPCWVFVTELWSVCGVRSFVGVAVKECSLLRSTFIFKRKNEVKFVYSGLVNTMEKTIIKTKNIMTTPNREIDPNQHNAGLDSQR